MPESPKPGVRRLLDTDIVIDLQHKHPPAVAWFAGLDLSLVALAGFMAMELSDRARNAIEARAADAIIRPLARVWPSPTACEAALSDFRPLPGLSLEQPYQR